MKIKKSIGLLALACVLSASIGFSLAKVEANAETVYTSSQKDYWQIVEGSGDYTVSLDTAARNSSSGYKGVETVVTPADGVTDIAIELKGMVNPMANMIIYHDNQVKGEADADAIVYTYTSLTDPDKQVSIIAVNRGNRSWYTLSLTDDLEIKDGYAYIAGTNQKTIGLMDGTTYNTTGFNNWGAGENNWGAIYCGDVQQKIDSTGKTYNTSMTYGTISNETFLTLSKENLAGTEYEERYTSEYVAEVLTELAKGARFEMKWYGVKTDKVDFHIRGISGSWIGDNGGNGLEYNLGVKHSLILYKKTNTLYVGKTYKLSDLVYGGGYTFRNAQNASAPLSLSGWYANDSNITAGNSSTSTWYNALTQMDKTITLTETGTYNMTMTGSFLGYYPTSATSGDFNGNFTFDVVLPDMPIVTATAENISLVGKTTYDLTSFFTIENGSNVADTVYTVDGVTVTNPTLYTADGKNHTIVCTVTDAYGQTVSATVNGIGVWVGDKFFTSTDGTVDYMTGVASNAGGNSGVRTEISNVTGSNITITYNQTLSAGLGSGDMFAFDKYTDAEGKAIAVADMVVITYTSLDDPTKQLSVVNHNNGTGYNCTTLSFTDNLEYRNHQVFIKGTNQTTVGGSAYNFGGYANATGPVFGSPYFYIDINADGSVQHTQYAIYGNILNATFLSNSRAKLDASSPYYNLYTAEYAQEVLTAITTGKCQMKISYYGLNENRSINTIGFNIAQLNSQWLGTSANTFTATYPYIFANRSALYIGETYTVGDIVDLFSTHRVEGVVTAVMEGWTDANNIGDSTWVNNSTVFTKTFTPSTIGTWSIKITTRCAPTGQAFSDRFYTQIVTFDVMALSEPIVTPMEESISLVGKTTYDLSSFFMIEDATSMVYTVDGIEIANYTTYVADGKDHIICCTVADDYGQTASATINGIGVWVGDKFFTSTDGTVDYMTGVTSNAGGNSGVRTEISNVTESNITITYNQTLSAGLGSGDMFAFDKYTDADGKAIAVADMVVITYTSLADPTKQLSIINHNNGTGYNCTTLSFTDNLEYRNHKVYIKGTNQTTVGGSAYNFGGYANATGPVFGSPYYYIEINSDGSVQHNQYAIYGNILNATFLSNSRANLDASSPYYNRYTAEYAQEVLTAITTGKCSMTISYYGLNENRTNETIGFNIAQLNSQWLGTSANTFTLTTPFALGNCSTLYVGESYTIGDIVDIYAAYRVNGVVVAVMDGWTNANNIGNDTWVNNSTIFTKTFIPNTAGTWSVKVRTYFAPSGQSYSDRYSEQVITFNVAYKLNVEIDGEMSTTDVITENYVLPTLEQEGVVFLGWLYNGELYGAGSVLAITENNQTISAQFMSFETPDFASARISGSSGVRFTTYLEKSAFDDLNTLVENGSISYKLYTKITSVHSSKAVQIDIAADRIYLAEDGLNYFFYSAIVDILPQNYTRVFFAESYLEITYADGTIKTIKTETIENREGRSFAYVIDAAANDYKAQKDDKYCHEITVDGETVYAPVDSTTYGKICTLNNTNYGEAVIPFVEVYVQGENRTSTYREAIKEYFTANVFNIGDSVDLTDIASIFGDGYAIDYENSNYYGTVTVNGLELSLSLIEDYLVQGGVSEYSIVYGSDVNRYIAEQMQSYIKQVTGATLPISADSGEAYDKTAKVISLGSTTYQAGADLSNVDYDTLETDGFIIKRVGNNYIIDSATTDGVAYGVYHFASKMLGVEFLTRSDAYIPTQNTIAGATLDIHEVPAFAIRDYYAYDVWQWASTSARFGMNSSALLPDSRFSGSNYNYDYYGYYYGEEQASKYSGQVYTPAAVRDAHTIQYMLMADAYINGVTSSYSQPGNESDGGHYWPIGYYGKNPNWYAWDPNYKNRVNTKYGEELVTDISIKTNSRGYSQEEICWTNGLTKNADGSLSYVAGSTDAVGSVVEKLVEICIKMIDDSLNYNSKYIMLGFADFYCECQCGSWQTSGLIPDWKDGLCTHGYSYYGGFGGVVANTVNEIAKAVKAQRPNSNAIFMTFAYGKGMTPPTNLSLREDVAVKFAYRNCASHALMDTTCTHNDELRENLAGWRNALHENGEIAIWDYTVNFSDYLYYMPNYEAMKANYQYYRDALNVQHVLSQGCPTEYNFYEHYLHHYVSTKLMWEPDLDIAAVISKFDDLYFGNYASYVAEYRIIMDTMYANKSIHASTADGLNYKDASTYDATALQNACNKLQEAINAVNADDALTAEEKTIYVNRLRSVKITPQYMLLDMGLSIDQTLATDFFESIEILGLTNRSDAGNSFADMKAEFEIS